MIVRASNIAQVADAVVRRVVVDVVKLVFGPHTMNIQPRQPVHLVRFAVNVALQVSACT